MACTPPHRDDALSDSEFPSGLPSPNESDDDESQKCSDFRLTVTAANFCNKLRKQARPLLGLFSGVASPARQLKEATDTKSKDSKAKKRLFRGKQEPPNGIIERRYGYIPNPRWPKGGNASFGKHFDPQSIHNNVTDSVPGTIFRKKNEANSKCNDSRLMSEHSYQDKDFPELQAGGVVRSFGLETEMLNVSSGQVGDISINKSTYTNNIERTEVWNETGSEIISSTPKQKSYKVSPSSFTPSSSERSFYSCPSPSPFDDESSLSRKQSELSSNSSGVWIQNKERQAHSNSYNLRGGRCSKKLCPSPLVNDISGASSQKNSHCDFVNDSRLSPRMDSSSHLVDSLEASKSWPRVARQPLVTELSQANNIAKHVQVKHAAFDFKHILCPTSTSPGSSWPSVTKDNYWGTSEKNQEEIDGRNRMGQNVIACTDSDSLCSMSSASGGAVQMSSPTWSQIIGVSESPNNSSDVDHCCKSKRKTPVVGTSQVVEVRRVSPGLHCPSRSSVTRANDGNRLPSAAPSPPLGIEQDQKENRQRGKGTKTKGKKEKKTQSNLSGDRPVFRQSGSCNKTFSRNGNTSFPGKPRTLTLENFMTPKKTNLKDNSQSCSKKDVILFENRFTEQLEASATSPPKKVRPSPIKKLHFSRKADEDSLPTQSAMLASGDAKEEQINLIEYGSQMKDLKKCIEDKASSKKSSDCGRDSVKLDSHKYDAGENGKIRRAKADDIVFSLEKHFQDKAQIHDKDVFDEEDESGEEFPHCSSVLMNTNGVEGLPAKINFSLSFRVLESENVDASISSDDDEYFSPVPYRPMRSDLKANPEDTEPEMGEIQEADISKVTFKMKLKKYAQQYCHMLEDHQVPNIAVELYFVIQLLTCTRVDLDAVKYLDKKMGGTYFRSVHNGVYFAVLVVKQLKRLFFSLDKTYLELLARNPRVQTFSPSLQTNILKAVASRTIDPVMPSQIEHTTFNPLAEGVMSFSDTNCAHVFKCQRDNFYALYRHYHDTSSVYELKMEKQIQYVFDGNTTEQNSVGNLMHLAKLFLEHMILCCVKQAGEKVDILQMIQCKGRDEELFKQLYEAFQVICGTTSGTANPPPGFSGSELFFRDFIETLSCPAFNEYLRGLLVSKILELNAQTFGSVCNLHSSATVGDNDTPLRTEHFTETVLTLCILGKTLGYLTFSPFSSGSSNIPVEQRTALLTVREMTPLPLPLPLILQQAYDTGSLALTVPWVVNFLSFMDSLAPQLTVYNALLRKLCYIQKYSWNRLYKGGHHNTGLLIVSCISWLFEAPPVPSGFFFSCEDVPESKCKQIIAGQQFNIDQQKLVSQRLLSSCCPYLDQGQVLLTMFALQQTPEAVREPDVLPVAGSCIHEPPVRIRGNGESTEIQTWLGSALGPVSSPGASSKELQTPVIDDEVVPAYFLSRFFIKKKEGDLEDLELNFLCSSPYLRESVQQAVALVCGKLEDFAQRTILRALVFDAKLSVRRQFHQVEQAEDMRVIKNKIEAQIKTSAAVFTEKAKESYMKSAEMLCQKELPDLLRFLTSNMEENIKETAVQVARKMAMRRLQEWASVQIYPAFFRRVIIREAEKCTGGNVKCLNSFPNDFSRKPPEPTCPTLDQGFGGLEQLSDLLDKALSYGVWYMNALTPGPRPDDKDMVKLIQDFTACVENHMVTMDFAFYVMANFLMHLIIQYLVDAPENWTPEAEDAFIRLCWTCKERKLHIDKTTVQPADNARKKKMTVKVLNLMSVHSIQWLTKSGNQKETVSTYTRLLTRLVDSQLLRIRTVINKLLHTQANRNLDVASRALVDEVLLELLNSKQDQLTTDNGDGLAGILSELHRPEEN